MLVYKKLVSEVLNYGEKLEGRNGTMYNLFGKQLELPALEDGFPILTSRKMYYEGVLGEMAAFLQGPQHITDFRKHGCNYWNEWADENGDIKIDYGNKWLDFGGMNQLHTIVKELQEQPHSRRNVLTGWDPSGISELSLPCCHYAYQFMVDGRGRLDMVWIQRSADVMIGLPSDMIAAATFLILMAQTTGYIPGRVIMQLGSTHIYGKHIAQVDEYLNRRDYPHPEWKMDPEATIYNFEPSHLGIFDYVCEGPINFELIV